MCDYPEEDLLLATVNNRTLYSKAITVILKQIIVKHRHLECVITNGEVNLPININNFNSIDKEDEQCKNSNKVNELKAKLEYHMELLEIINNQAKCPISQAIDRL